MKRWAFVVLAVVSGLCPVTIGADTVHLPLVQVSPFTLPGQWGRVFHIVDGDTFDVVLECCDCIEYFRVRPVGVNTPERGQCYYGEAKEATRSLIDGQRVYLVRDHREWGDRWRLLRHVFTEQGVWLNAYLVRRGYAKVMTVEPDDRWARHFEGLQDKATAEGAGGWGQCHWAQGVDFGRAWPYNGATN